MIKKLLAAAYLTLAIALPSNAQSAWDAPTPLSKFDKDWGGVYRKRAYSFRKNIGSLYVRKVVIEKEKRRKYRSTRAPWDYTTNLRAYVKLPTCSRRYYLSGNIKIIFRSKQGNRIEKKVFYAHRRANYEGQTMWISASHRRGLNPEGGKVWISHNLTCKSLAPFRNNGGKPNTDWLKKHDPTKGIFW